MASPESESESESESCADVLCDAEAICSFFRFRRNEGVGGNRTVPIDRPRRCIAMYPTFVSYTQDYFIKGLTY